MRTDYGCPYESKLGQSLCVQTNDWTLAYLRKFDEGPSYSPLHSVDVQTLRIG